MKFKQKYLLDRILMLAVIGVILVSGCAKKEVTCNPPYIKVGTSCCLDQNNNSICDKDEAERNQSSPTGKIIEKGPSQPEKTAPSCTDECSSEETKCVDYNYYECGNYDGDPCSEWGSEGITVEKCDVECKTNLDCDLEEECKSYECKATCDDECSLGDEKCEGIIITNAKTMIRIHVSNGLVKISWWENVM